MATLEVAIPKGSWILVTGANSFVASHIVLELLNRGYKVRGTVRSLSRTSWLTTETFASQHADGSFELAEVSDLEADGAFDEAVKGVSGVVHVASVVMWEPNPHKVIPPSIAGVVNMLKAAAAEPSVKRFVFTSSFSAAAMVQPDTPMQVDKNSWNETAVRLAYAPPPYHQSRSVITYMASKVESEKALWKFAQEQKPHFTVNTVCPLSILGRILNPKHQRASSAGNIVHLYKGEVELIKYIPPMCYINIRDVAIIHAAAILDPEIANERIIMSHIPFNWNSLLASMRKLRPNHKFIDDMPNLGTFMPTTDTELGLRLMKKWAGQDGWTGLEQGLKENIEHLED